MWQYGRHKWRFCWWVPCRTWRFKSSIDLFGNIKLHFHFYNINPMINCDFIATKWHFGRAILLMDLFFICYFAVGNFAASSEHVGRLTEQCRGSYNSNEDGACRASGTLSYARGSTQRGMFGTLQYSMSCNWIPFLVSCRWNYVPKSG